MKLQSYVRDIVYGASDGVITTFAIVAGVVGAELSLVTILIMGFANLLADGFSMASANYLGIESERDVAKRNNSPLPADARHPLYSALVTFFSFVAAGLIPLLPYLLFPTGENMFIKTILATAGALLVIGGLRGFVAQKHFIRTACETLIVGTVAATIAYSIGAFLRGLLL